MHVAFCIKNCAITTITLSRLKLRSKFVRIITTSSAQAYSSRSNAGGPAAKGSESFVNGTSGSYVEQMFNAWCRDPNSVHPSWDAYFRTNNYDIPPDMSPLRKNTIPIHAICGGDEPDSKVIEEHLAVTGIIRAYQTRGHLAANIDPLGIKHHTHGNIVDGAGFRANEEVLQSNFNFLTAGVDLNQTYTLPMTCFIGGEQKSLSLREILQRLEQTYCSSVGIEYMYITSIEQCQFIRQQFETPGVIKFTKEEKLRMLSRVLRATGLESFLARKYPSEKRFGLEGCEVLIPAMKEIIDSLSAQGVDSFIIGMAHRGRLNVLANICRKPLHFMLSQFNALAASDQGSGDVKYHLGMYIERMNRATSKNIRVAVVANPSHLEAVNAVVQGKVRAEQFYRGDRDGKQVVALLLHGDASFCGQGVCYESMHMTELPEYTTHGAIHVVVNNQIGFTTDPRFHRSSPYCTDLGRVVNAPIFHVNGDDVEAAVHCTRVACAYRMKYKKDVVLDLVGYRRNGHNEADEPAFTQPLMYKKIRQHPTLLKIYSDKLIKEGLISTAEIKKISDEYDKICDDAFEMAKKETHIKYKEWLDSPWSGFFEGKDPTKVAPTGVSLETLLHIANKFSSPPPNAADFVIHRGIERILAGRKTMVNEMMADWAMGEALAFGTLLKEGIHVRLSGQDVERGTFSHRHHVLHHQTVDMATYNPLQHLYPDQASYTVCNSSLSEFGVLGFEHGYSVTSPNSLVLWEAQFGDFANTAQCMIDQFIASGQSKWVRQCGLVMLLPHGMEGMGPEHSSGRIERFLKLCNDNEDCMQPECKDMVVQQLQDTNWIVANCTVPANFYHIIRRQIALPFRKPLILVTPKSLLRHPLAKSNFCEMAEGSSFKRMIFDDGSAGKHPEKVKRLVICSGKVYYDLLQARADKKNGDEEFAIVRLEQICPFPFDLMKKLVQQYTQADIVWAQEEHRNQGCWSYVWPRINTLLRELEDDRTLDYCGRDPSCAPATGNKKQYEKEYKGIMIDVFGDLTDEEKAVIKAKAEKAKAEALANAVSTAAKPGGAAPATSTTEAKPAPGAVAKPETSAAPTAPAKPVDTNNTGKTDPKNPTKK